MYPRPAERVAQRERRGQRGGTMEQPPLCPVCELDPLLVANRFGAGNGIGSGFEQTARRPLEPWVSVKRM